MDEDLYFWGMYKKKIKEIKEMDEQLMCSKCGSKQIYRVTVLEPTFVDVDIPFKCQDCKFVGIPKIIKSKKE